MAASRNNALAFCLALFFSYTAFGQVANVDLNRKIVIKPGTLSLDSVFHIVARQTGVVFSYDANRLNIHQRVQVIGDVVTFKKILAILTEANGLCIKQLENHIIVAPCGKNNVMFPRREVPKTKRSTVPNDTGNHQHIPVNSISLPEDSVAQVAARRVTSAIERPGDSLSRSRDTVRIRQEIVKIPVTPETTTAPPDSVVAMINTKPPVVDEQMTQTQTQATEKTNRHSPDVFVKIGVPLDESRYSGVVIQAGVPVFYATFGANTNFKVSYIQYGLGTGFQLASDVRFLLTVSRGSIERSGHYTDSIKNQYPVRVKSNLTRASVAVEIFLSKKIGIQVGPVFNYLTTRYYIDNKATNLAAFERGDEIFSTIWPPYLIMNTYSSAKDSNVKTWIGLQVSVLYHVKF